MNHHRIAAILFPQRLHLVAMVRVQHSLAATCAGSKKNLERVGPDRVSPGPPP